MIFFKSFFFTNIVKINRKINETYMFLTIGTLKVILLIDEFSFDDRHYHLFKVSNLL